MRSFLPKLGVLLAGVHLGVGCGSSPSNLYDAVDLSQASAGSGATGARGGASGVGGSAQGGQPSNGGQANGGQANGGQASNGGQPNSGGAGAPNDAPCHPVKDVSGGMSGPINTLGAACLRITDPISGWGCSNFDGRTVKVNGRELMCAGLPLPDKIDGAYYFDISPGTLDYASLYWY
jgi:hypothetical protein